MSRDDTRSRYALASNLLYNICANERASECARAREVDNAGDAATRPPRFRVRASDWIAIAKDQLTTYNAARFFERDYARAFLLPISARR